MKFKIRTSVSLPQMAKRTLTGDELGAVRLVQQKADEKIQEIRRHGQLTRMHSVDTLAMHPSEQPYAAGTIQQSLRSHLYLSMLLKLPAQGRIAPLQLHAGAVRLSCSMLTPVMQQNFHQYHLKLHAHSIGHQLQLSSVLLLTVALSTSAWAIMEHSMMQTTGRALLLRLLVCHFIAAILYAPTKKLSVLQSLAKDGKSLYSTLVSNIWHAKPFHIFFIFPSTYSFLLLLG